MHRTAGLLLLWVAMLPESAPAQGVRGSLVLTTDYVQRGLSQSDGQLAVQGSLTWWHPTGWYGGVWASNIDSANRYFYGPYADSANAEVDLFAGHARHLSSDWLLDLKAVGYLYPNDPAPVSYNYLELGAGLTWRERWRASLAYTPSTTWLARARGTRSRPAFSGELSLQQPVSAWLTWIVGVGYREMIANDVPGYVYGSTSLALQLDRMNFEVGHFVTDAHAEQLFGARLAGSRTVFTVSFTF